MSQSRLNLCRQSPKVLQILSLTTFFHTRKFIVDRKVVCGDSFGAHVMFPFWCQFPQIKICKVFLFLNKHCRNVLCLSLHSWLICESIFAKKAFHPTKQTEEPQISSNHHRKSTFCLLFCTFLGGVCFFSGRSSTSSNTLCHCMTSCIHSSMTGWAVLFQHPRSEKIASMFGDWTFMFV